MGENPIGRIGKGSLAMYISQGLVDPKSNLSKVISKGKRVHIPVPCNKSATIVFDQTFVDR
jgi:hypothetical protein